MKASCPRPSLARPWFHALLVIAFLLACAGGSQTVQAAGPTTIHFYVNSTEDLPDHDLGDENICDANIFFSREPKCTLRAAIQEASTIDNFQATDIFIHLAAGAIYELSIPAEETKEDTTGDLNLHPHIPIHIEADRGTKALIRWNTTGFSQANSRLLNIDSNNDVTVTIQNVSFSRGNAVSTGSQPSTYGGCVRSYTPLKLNNVFFTGCHADADHSGTGGALYIMTSDDAPLTEITNVRMTGNSAYYGGAIFVAPYTPVLIENSTIDTNTAEVTGGIFSHGTTVLQNVTISGNQSQNNAAALQVYGGQAEIYNVTIENNQSAALGSIAVFNNGKLIARNSIITKTLQLGSTTFSSNVCLLSDGGQFISNGHNIIGDATCGSSASDQIHVSDVKLGLLAMNGGSTPTHALLSGSPAIDAADNVGFNGENDPETPFYLLFDQRGMPRPYNDRNDVGAFEYQMVPTFLPFLAR